MSLILRSRYGFLKHFLLGLLFSLGCLLTVFADPISGTAILTSLLISAAVTAATTVATYLFTPKVKTQPKDTGKLQGEIQISSVGEDIPINEIFGSRGADDLGGILTGINIFYASEIRKTVTQTSVTTAASGRGGKGGRGGQTQTTNESHYHIDLACLNALGRTRILEIRAGTDVIYKNYPAIIGGSVSNEYEAESGTLTGTTPNPDANFSNGYNVPMMNGATATYSVTGDGKPHAIHIVYYCIYDDCVLNVTIAGVAMQLAVPNTYGAIASVMLVGTLLNGATTVFIQYPGSNPVWLDKIIVGQEFALVPEVVRFGGLSGVKNNNYVNPKPFYDNLALVEPLQDDYRSEIEYNYQPVATALGEQVVTLPAGCNLRIYEGTETQLPDPMLQTYFEGKYGANSTPANRGRNYFVLENFEISKYGSVPNITVISESIELTTVGAMFAARSKRAGLTDAEFDYSALESVPLRGFAINARQSPRTEMELLNRIFDLDVYENTDGKIEGVIPNEDILIRLPSNVLDVYEGERESNQPLKTVSLTVKNEFELAKRLDLSYFDPSKNYEIGNAHATREITVSERRENIETSLVLTESEAQKISDRLHQKEWAEKDSANFTTFYRYGWLNPTDLIEVEDSDGTIHTIRLKERQGSVPGALTFSGVTRNVLEPFPRIFTEPLNAGHAPPWVDIPAHIIGTIFDSAVLRDTETTAGFYAACVMRDQLYKFKGASMMWEREGGYALLDAFKKQATLGRTVSGSTGVLADVGGTWAQGNFVDSPVTFDLYFGEVETLSEAKVLDGQGILIVGNEVVGAVTATRVNGFPNRWTVSHLQRRLKGTFSAGHIANERVLLLTDAVRFIPLDSSEFGKTRNYKFVSSGQDINSASALSFNWDGNTNPYSMPPTPTLTFLQQQVTGRNGETERQIIGTVSFGAFDYPQKCKILWAKPGAGYQFYCDLTPDASNQSVFVIANAPVGDNYFRVIAYSASGEQSTAMNDSLISVASLNTELKSPVIESAGSATLTSVPVGIKNYSEKVRYRKIEVSSNSGFTPGTVSTTIHNFFDTVNIFGAIENITRAYSAAPEMKYVRVSHSTDGENYTNPSNILTVVFRNEAGDGVPVLANGSGKIFDVVGNNWLIDLPKPIQNGQDAALVQYKFLDATHTKNVQGQVAPSATSLTLNNTDNFPDNGKLYAANGESLSYSSKSGNTLNGLARGIEGDTPVTLADGSLIYLITFRGESAATQVFFPRDSNDYIVQYRWRNGYRENGSDGFSKWYLAGTALGQTSVPAPPPPAPPPAVDPDPAVIYPNYEDPYAPPECFCPAADEPVYVWMADNSSRPIQDVKIGELVKCKLNGEIVNRPIEHLFRNTTKGFYRIKSDDSLPVTGKHPFYSQGSTVRADKLEAGTILECTENNIEIISTKPILENRTTYNHEVSDAHNYFVRGRLNAAWKLVGNMRAKQRGLTDVAA